MNEWESGKMEMEGIQNPPVPVMTVRYCEPCFNPDYFFSRINNAMITRNWTD
jgi:hypothetical protein